MTLFVMAFMMTQYSLKAGMRKFGAKAKKGLRKELEQLHIMDTWEPQDPTKLTREERMRALSSLMFLKEKRDQSMKGRLCINGAPQRAYIPKEDAASPTVATESVFMTSAVAAKERRFCRFFDVPGAFLNTETDEDVVMVLKDELADAIVSVAPEVYRPFVTVNRKGKSVLYVKLKKALYGMLRSSLLFYRKLRSELEADGFVVNPYDPCVANKWVTTAKGEEKQMTVIWHVDDLMATCEDNLALTRFGKYLGKIYGEKLSCHVGPRHDYLGMNLELGKDGRLGVDMIEFLDGIIRDFPEEISGRAATPASDRLFDVRDAAETESTGKYLDEERAKAFHRAVAQLLFMSCRPRRDIQTAVSFLTTRVKKPDEDDWGKLKRLLRYLKCTRNLKPAR